ncbi:hypothetical protein [Pseudidiomarina insulisalsae]|uniref:SsuA/THI5-like domain-containing protein n=1 Tax=Pseudidiomarina insulisalsae TaxID=575789 RepID=A0A432YPA4_9GAMM|nr:hypothetical protein [Pseudidiomarina insulisalsae]RUO62948.1 hypothetical protein CWI71_01590 [Pseudidiomarina insulisalsae]
MQRTLLILCSFLLLGCQQQQQKAVIVANSWLGAAPLFATVTTEPESFPAQLKTVMLASDVSVLRMLSNGAAAGAIVTLDNALGINTLTEGDYCIAMVVDHSRGADAILARADWSYDIHRPLRVGLEDSTLARYMLTSWLKAANIPPRQVQSSIMLPSEQLQAFTENKIDFIVTYQPFVERLKQVGANVIFSSRQHRLEIFDVLIVEKHRWPELSGAILSLREQTWPQTQRLLAEQSPQFWLALQALTDTNEAELQAGLQGIEFIGAGQQMQALEHVLGISTPAIAAHLVEFGVYDRVTPLTQCGADS